MDEKYLLFQASKIRECFHNADDISGALAILHQIARDQREADVEKIEKMKFKKLKFNTLGETHERKRQIIAALREEDK